MKLTESEKKRLKSCYGEWAIVTGATSGIGRELATQLASAGINLIIVARHLNDLSALSTELTSVYHISVRIVDVDVSAEGSLDRIIVTAQGLNVGLLVVSAGYGTSGLFVDSSLHAEINMLRVNSEALLSATHYFAQRFVLQKRGGIILMSSMVAFQGVPYAAHYAATKAYVQTLAEALSIELRSAGVDVLAAAPGPVESGFGSRSNMKMNMSLSPSQVGVPILRALGRQTTVLPGLLTKVLVYALRTVPRWAKVRIMQQVMGGFTQHQRAAR